MASATLSKLPYELLRFIIENLPASTDLQSVALTSRLFLLEAQRALFMDPKLTTPLAHVKFLKTVAASPNHLAPLVNTYTQLCILPRDKWSDSNAKTVAQQIQNLTGNALRVMVNLKRLAYRSSCAHESTIILRGCTFKLRALTWVCHGQDGDILLQEILPQQPDLKHLGLLTPAFTSSRITDAARSLCPALESLAGPAQIFPLFLPGRKVRYLHWTADLTASLEHTLAEDDTARLPKELRDIRYFIHNGYPLHVPLSSIIRHLHAVQILKTVTCSPEEYQSLELLPQLRQLILTPNLSVHDFHANPTLRLQAITRIFNFCKSLLYVDWKIAHRLYVRYTVSTEQGHFDTVDVSEEEVFSWRDDRGCFGIF